MLKALELIGFKSFADKTRFEFDEGITVVVGPNGSGKSNVVDAIKWVMGETSAKSLRGKEMTDCIFNGSSSRHEQNSAEITLEFDNTRGLLDIDSPQVHITRRVYRSGEGEYFINRQACRRRDIRDLLAGTGMGSGAYCIIEQGKVDSLLQSSPHDRRVIFEEAAGISRFRVKKVETLRRLDRVEQNLMRLKDIVDEVDNRLRTVRSQASKARRYREHTSRLRELRTQVGLVDWRRLSEQLAGLDEQLTALRVDSERLATQGESLEAGQAELENLVAQTDEQIHNCESQLAETIAAIAMHDSTIQHESNRGRDLEDEIARYRRQVIVLNLRAGDLAQQSRQTFAAVETAQVDHNELKAALADDESAMDELVGRLDSLRESNERRRSEYMNQMRSVAALGNEISALESQAVGDAEAITRSRQRVAEADEEILRLEDEHTRLRGELREFAATIQDRHNDISLVQQTLVDQRSQQAAWQNEAGGLRQRQTGASERAALLKELEHRQEGLSTGAKDILHEAQTSKNGPWRHVLGVVADMFHVNIQTAPLLELALGDAVAHIVIRRDKEILDHLTANSSNLASRVSFIPFDSKEPPPDFPDLDGRPGVVARIDRFVETSPQFRGLAARLLGRTWVMETLQHALAIARQAAKELPEAQLRFVTLAGEMVLPEGVLTLGPRQLSAGLISRRSELRSLEKQIVDVQRKIDHVEDAREKLEQLIAEDEQSLQKLAVQHRDSSEALGERRQREQSCQHRIEQLQSQRAAIDAEAVAAENRLAQGKQSVKNARAKLAAGETNLAELERFMESAAREIIGLDQRRQDNAATITSSKVELAKSEERLDNLRERSRQFEKDCHERQRTIQENRAQIAASAARLGISNRDILAAESRLAELYLRKENLVAEIVHLTAAREAYRRQRIESSGAAARLHSGVRKLDGQVHAKDLAAGEVRLQRASLAQRLQEDYGIDLASMEQTIDGEPGDEELQQREPVEDEIAELRRKIANIGNVNLEALEELEDLESRFSTLSEQYEDLGLAKRQLVEIINKINVDSRRMFAETMQTVRGHFQQLFRKLFGGGQADIVLEEGVDMLESGIEINARPPGKELRNISLLSGGEKTLTCVALLLAIFRSKPAPFCVLDEVDAALDEVNIGRFINVLKEFLQWTQFIVITHSKKTMTCATTLYGVTMQESGVSKRVSVRFEDVNEDGEIQVKEDRSKDKPADGGDDETQAA